MIRFLKRFRKPNPILIAIIFIFSVAWIGWWVSATGNNALDLGDEKLYRGRVIEVVEEYEASRTPSGRTGIEQDLLVEVSHDGTTERMRTINDLIPVKKGTEVLVQGNLSSSDPQERLYVVDVIRTRGLLWLAIAFAALVLIVAGIHGAYALIGLLFSFAVIFNGIVPALLNGYHPVLVGLVGAMVILIVTLYVSHGLNRKSFAAFVGITLALVLVGLVASFVASNLYLTGYGPEETMYLTLESGQSINLVDLLIAGIIIAAIGILDDIAITQASTVFNLVSVDPSLRGMRLFRKAMAVGHDHISAVINTLVLAYTGAALPLILLLTIRQFPLGFVVNGEILAEEIVRTLISSSGLVFAVPLTTLVAVYLAGKAGQFDPSETHSH